MDIEEICLQCGKLVDDGRPYCSQECAKCDVSSTSSSAFSSPHFDPMTGALPDVPTLVPSALGSALRQSPYGRYASSSAWSQVSDDDDDHRVFLHTADDDSKTPGSRPFGLMYARRPSTTNKPSTLSVSNPHSNGHPRSIPTRARYSSTDDDSGSSPPARSPRGSHRLQPPAKTAPSAASPSRATPSEATTTPASMKKRNRASLPAYFQLLAVSPNPSTSGFSPSYRAPLSRRNSQGSLPTPTVAQAPSIPSTATMHERAAAERGRRRRREVGEPSAVSRTRSGRGSPSNSPRRRRSSPPRGMYEADESELEFEFEFDARAEEPRRGRSPRAVPRDSGDDGRGRWRAEFDGVDASDPYAPGFGKGRSGLRDRASREPFGRSHRSPLVAYP